MSIECKCDECRKEIYSGEDMVCFICYKTAMDNIEDLKEKIQYLETIIEEMKDE